MYAAFDTDTRHTWIASMTCRVFVHVRRLVSREVQDDSSQRCFSVSVRAIYVVTCDPQYT